MSTAIRTIVAGIASIRETDPIVASAVALAEATGADLHFVHVYELPDPLLHAYARDGLLGPHFGGGYGDELRRRLEAQVREVSTREGIHCHAVAGPATDRLCEMAATLDADLLVIGATRAGKFLRSILGSTAERVIRTACMPVLVVRQPIVGPAQRVLLTTDLSEFSAGVHESGIDMVEALFGQATPAIRTLLVVWYDVAFPPPLRRDSLEQVAAVELDQFVAARRRRERDIARSVRIGDPSKEITAESIDWGADLLILGTHSRSGRSRFLLGSVAEATVRGTTTNVLVLPPTAVHAEDGLTADGEATLLAAR